VFPTVSATHVRLNITGSYSTSTVSLEQFEVNLRFGLRSTRHDPD
jgi:hypothetical protein